MNNNQILADSLERMADLVRRQHPSLDSMPLRPQAKYQGRTVALETLTQEIAACLANGFQHRDADDFPMLICAWGKCRVGSTPLSNVFALAGMPSYHQPVKSILRHALLDSRAAPWLVPSAAKQPEIFAKETAGPYVLAESLFVPLQPLVEAGYPPNRLHILILDREPASSLASWLDKWSDRASESTLLHNYVIAALNALRVESYAKREGIPVTHYVYEASREAVSSVRGLFARLGLATRFSEDIVTDWNEMGQLESEGTRIIFPDVPAIFPTSGIHGSDSAYRYRARKTAALTDAQWAVLDRYGIDDIYRASVAACARDLGLSATTSARLFGDRVVGAA